MKSQLHQIDFKTVYFVTNGKENAQTKAHSILSQHMHPNDLVEDVLETSNDYANLVDIINEDEIINDPYAKQPMPPKTYYIKKTNSNNHCIHYQVPKGNRGIEKGIQFLSHNNLKQFEDILIEANYTKIKPKD